MSSAMYLFSILLCCLSCKAYGHGYDDFEEETPISAAFQKMSNGISKILQILRIMSTEKKTCIGQGDSLKNLALKKPTFQSSTLTVSKSEKAVDGISNPDWKAGSCAHTLSETHPYWLVDLGRKHLIQRVEITNREDCCVARLHDVEVTVAGDDKNFDVSCGIFKGPGLPAQKVVQTCPVGISGRYVKLQIIKGTKNILTLCEVRVIGK